MIRKSLIALAAIATLGAAALVPTAASAGWKGGWHGHHVYKPYWGFYGPHYVGYGYRWAADCYWVKRQTPWGKKLVKVCY